METYKLNELISFFKKQKIIKYNGINLVLSILSDESIGELEQKQRILNIFRRFGLYEENSLRKFKSKEQNNQTPFDESQEEMKLSDIGFCIELFNIQLLNGV